VVFATGEGCLFVANAHILMLELEKGLLNLLLVKRSDGFWFGFKTANKELS